MLKDKFSFTHRDTKQQYNATREEGGFTITWGEKDRFQSRYLEESVQGFIDDGSWILVPEKKPLPADFFFKSKTGKNCLLRATKVGGVYGEQYRVDWITQGGYPETQGYLPVEAVQRFVETEEWVVTEAPKAEGPKVFTAPLTNEDVFAYGCEVGAKVSVTRGHERDLVTVDFQHDEADFSVKVYNGNQDLLVSMLNAVSAVIYARKRK
jgi:hypothetical protein